MLADGLGHFRFETAGGAPIPRPLPAVRTLPGAAPLGGALDPAVTAHIRPHIAGTVDGSARHDRTTSSAASSTASSAPGLQLLRRPDRHRR